MNNVFLGKTRREKHKPTLNTSANGFTFSAKKANKLQTIKQERYIRSTLPHADLQEPRGFHRSFSSIANKAEGKNTQYMKKKVNEPGLSPTSLVFSVKLLSREWIIPVLNNP